jgi:hypothetical protein
VFYPALVLFSKNLSTTWGLSTRKVTLISGKPMPMAVLPILKNSAFNVGEAAYLLFISYFRLRNKRAMSTLPRVHITKLPSMSSSWQCRSTADRISDSFSMTPTAIIEMNSYLSSMEQLQTNIVHQQSLGRRSRNESSSTAVL